MVNGHVIRVIPPKNVRLVLYVLILILAKCCSPVFSLWDVPSTGIIQ